MLSFKYLLLTSEILLTIGIGVSYAQNPLPDGWQTDTGKSVINLDELLSGGPSKDGIPSIDQPEFMAIDAARSWISGREPVIALEYRGEARAYPLQILIWHEIVNDFIKGQPVLVTFCPLCYSALVFERSVEGEVLEFGVSGMLHHSNLVMYDRKTETLWQQFTGRSIVGDYVGTRLKQIPAQIISYDQFAARYPEGEVLSRNTGHRRNYGSNPYSGYDDIDNRPFFGVGSGDDRLRPMEKVIGVVVGEETKTYPYSITEEQNIIHDTVNDTSIVVFHLPGAQSALDASRISMSREVGSTGVFHRQIDGRVLTFELRSDDVYDRETGTRWSITGKGLEGPLQGRQLRLVRFGDYFAFSWLVFRPDTEIYTVE